MNKPYYTGSSRHKWTNQLKDMEYSMKEKQDLFQVRMKDIDVKANRTWKYEHITCRSCKKPNQIENQEHILFCKTLLNRNMKLTYLPTYQDLYSGDMKQQMYTSIQVKNRLTDHNLLNVSLNFSYNQLSKQHKVNTHST